MYEGHPLTGSLGKKTSLKSKQHWPSFIMILLPNHSEEFTYTWSKDNNPHIQFSDHIINLDFQRVLHDLILLYLHTWLETVDSDLTDINIRFYIDSVRTRRNLLVSK